MKKFEFGLLAVAVLVGSKLGSIYGTAIAICGYMAVTGLIEELTQYKKSKKVVKFEKKEDRKNA